MAEASSPLTFRDSVRHLLPTAAAICLFAPLLASDKLELGSLVFAAVLLGYVVTTPLTIFLGWLYRFTPAVKNLSRQREWIASNWDFDELFLNRLTQEEKEYVYLTGAYVDFYRQLAFYLLVYTGVNLFILVRAILDNPKHSGILQTILNTTTPIAGGPHFPAALLVIFSMLLGIYCFWDFLNEYSSLFLEGGIYPKFAAKSQTEKGGVAVSIWGMVRHGRAGMPGIKVELNNSQKVTLQSVTTDSNGYFQFENKFKDLAGVDGTLKASIGGAVIEKPVKADPKTIPSVDFDSSAIKLRTERQGWIRFAISSLLLSIVWGIGFIRLDVITIIALVCSIPFAVLLAIFLAGKKAALQDWKLSALLLACVILALTNISWFAWNIAGAASTGMDLRSSLFNHWPYVWYECLPPILLLAVFFVAGKLNVESKI
jgi:hypothetical protein